MARAVTLVDSGGVAVTDVGTLNALATPMTPVDSGGVAVTLVDSGGIPIVLVDEFGALTGAGGGGGAYSLQTSLTPDTRPAELYYARNTLRAVYYVKDSAASDPFSNAAGVIQQAGATHNIVFAGDSITQGFNPASFSFAIQLIRKLRTERSVIANYKIRGLPSIGLSYSSGNGDIGSMTAVAAADIDPARSGTLSDILVIFGGTNDIELGGTTGAATYTLLTTYIDARIAAGWTASRIYVVPMLPRGNGSEETDRGTYNSAIVADAGARGYQVVTIPSSMSAAAAQNDTTYYQADTIHPNNVGSGVIADAVLTKMIAAGHA